MGQELNCTLRYQRRKLEGKAYLETDHVLFRGPERLKILLKDLRDVSAAGGVLTLDFEGGPASFDLGPAAAKWAQKILHPPSRLEKLGIKPGMRIETVGEFESNFLREMPAPASASRGALADFILFAAAKKADLSKITRLIPKMKPDAALWVVYPKGVTAIREIDVIEAGRAAGLKDTKVVGFSATNTALRFVIPLTAR